MPAEVRSTVRFTSNTNPSILLPSIFTLVFYHLLVLSCCFEEITAGYISRQQVRNKSPEAMEGSTNRQGSVSAFSNKLTPDQTRKHKISNDQIVAMFRRNVQSTAQKSQFLHHHLKKQSKSIHDNKYGFSSHNFKYLARKRFSKSRVTKKSSHPIRNSYHKRGHRRHVKVFHKKIFSKNTRRNENSESPNVIDKRRLHKKFKSQIFWIKRKRKRVRERSNFHSK